MLKRTNLIQHRRDRRPRLSATKDFANSKLIKSFCRRCLCTAANKINSLRFRTVEDACPYGYEGAVSFLRSHIKPTEKSKFEDKLVFIGVFARTKLGHCRGDHWSSVCWILAVCSGRSVIAPTGLCTPSRTINPTDKSKFEG